MVARFFMNNEDIRTVKLLVNNEDAAKKIDTLKTKLEQLRVGQQKALESGDPKALKEYRKEIDKAERQLNQMQSRAVQVNKVLQNLDRSSLKDMQNTLKLLNKELASGHVARGSREWDVLTDAIRRTKMEIQKVKEEQEAAMSLKDKLINFGNTWMGVATTIGGALQAISGLRSTFNSAVKDFAEMEEAEAQVIKYTGLSKQAVRELNEELRKMDTRTSRERLNALAGDAGRLGIQSKKDILEFVDAADKINVALGEDLGEDAVKNIGKLTQLFGEDKRLGLRQGMLATGSAINELAQNSSASEPYILDFTGRLAGAAHQANITQANVMGLASTLDQNMVSAEKGATALQKVIVKMYQDPAKLARAAGLDVEQFAKLLKEDANAALLEFLQALSNMGSLDQLAPLFGDMQMSGAAIVQVLSTLSANIDNVRAQQELATRAFADGTSVTREFGVQNNTVQAELDKARKRFHDLSVELGEKLAPVMRYTMSTSSLMLRGMSLLVDFLKKYGIEVVTLTTLWTVYALRVKIATAFTTAYHAVLTFGINVVNGYRAAMILSRDAVVGCTLANQRMYRLMLSQNVLTKAFTAVTLLLKAAVYALKLDFQAAAASLKSFQVVMATTGPVYLAIAAIGILTASIIRHNQKMKEKARLQSEEHQRMREAMKDYTDMYAKIHALQKVVEDNNVALSERKKALDELKEIVPDYTEDLNDEGVLINNNTTALDEYLRKLKQVTLYKAHKDKLEELYRQNEELQGLESTQSEAYWNRRQTNTLQGYDRNSVPNRMVSSFSKTKVGRWFGMTTEASLEQDLNDTRTKLARNQAEINRIEGMVAKESQEIAELGSGGNGGGGGGGNGDDKDTKGDPFALTRKQMEDEAMQQRISLQSQYSLRLIDYRTYTEQMAQLDVDLYTRQRDLYAQNSEKWLELNKKVLEAQQKQQQNQTVWSLNQLDVETEEERKALFSRYAKGEIAEESYRQQLLDITMKYLKEKADLLRRDGTPEEANRAELEYQKESERQRQQSEEAFLKKYNDMKKKYLTLSAAEREKEEINLLDQLHAKQLINEEEYQKVLHQIRSKYKGEGEKEQETLGKQTLDNIGYKTVDTPSSTGEGISSGFTQLAAAAYNMKAASDAYAKLKELRQSDLISQAEYNAATTELDRQRFSNFQAMAQAAYATVSSLMASYSQFAQACTDAEVAKVTARYDKEIEAAGQNSVRGKKLEEKKQKEINKIKKREAKKQAAIQIAQALAATAMNAIQAYGCMLALGIPAGPVLAPIAAAAAVAAGMLQVATIKKQAEAQAAEYYTGGFTGGKNYRRNAGIVHEGEFVANHEAVNNPNVLPVLRLIDHAQRNNTIGSLTAADVSRAIVTPGSVAGGVATAMQPVVATAALGGGGTIQSEALDRLNRRLDEPIVAYVAMDEFDRQHRHYDRLKNRK